MENKKNYYAIIPANVRYDKKVTSGAKLLYGEITALCNEKGYCWANNSYFSQLYGVTNTTISTWIKQLINGGYINSKLIYKEGTKQIQNRYLKILSNPTQENLNTPPKKLNDPTQENLNTPTQENLKDNITLFNTTVNTTLEEKKERFNFRKSLVNYGFDEQLVLDWLKVRKSKKASNTETAFKKFISEVEKSHLEKNEVLEECVYRNWVGFKNSWIEKEKSSAKKEKQTHSQKILGDKLYNELMESLNPNTDDGFTPLKRID